MPLYNGAIAAKEAGTLPGLGLVNLAGSALESKDLNALFTGYVSAAADSGEVTAATTAGGSLSLSTSTRSTLNTRRV
jgi:hypothetical protein